MTETGVDAAAVTGDVRTPFPRRWVVPLLLVLAVGFLLGLRPLADNNLDYHLNGGRWIVEHRAVPQQDPHTYGANGRTETDLHWLFQVSLYSLYRLVGFAGLSGVNALLALALLGLLALRMRRLGAGPAAACWVLLAAAVAMHQRFLMRPENVSFLYLALLCLVLDRYLRSAAARHLWPLPLIHLLWVNTEGLFVLGWAVMGAYWLSSSLKRRGFDLALAAVAAVSVLICLANPYGLRGVLFPFELFHRFDRGNIVAHHVGEIQPFLAVAGLFEDYVFVGLVFMFAVACAVSWRRRRLHEAILAAVFGYLGLIGIRNVPLFVIVAAPVLAAALTDCARLAGSRDGGVVRAFLRPVATTGPARVLPRFGVALFIALATGLLLRMLTGAFFQTPGLPQGAVGVGLDMGMRPVAAGEFLLANGLDGRILNSSNIGGWLAWVLPQPVFMDMRLDTMGDDLFRSEVGSWEDGGLDRLLERWRPQLIVFDHAGGAKGWVGQLRDREDWRLIHLDGVAAVYASRGYAPGIPALDPNDLPARLGLPELPGEQELRRLLDRPVPGRARRWLSGFSQRVPTAGPWVALARFCELHGATATAERCYLEGLARDPARSADALTELAAIFGTTGRPELALLSYERYLRYEPDSPAGHNGRGIARVMLGDRAGAVRDFTRAIELDPKFELALLNRGLARLGLADVSGAVADYTRVLKLNPASEQARAGLQAARQELR